MHQYIDISIFDGENKAAWRQNQITPSQLRHTKTGFPSKPGQGNRPLFCPKKAREEPLK